jgi:ubiquinone/menaquinone biosynthesis C-methylase UbiE
MTPEPGLLFDRVAEEYDRVRLDYPAPLVDTACSLAGLEPGSPVVEIGCGTGKLTERAGERALRVGGGRSRAPGWSSRPPRVGSSAT